MNDLLDRLSSNVQAQRRFVADAAHQLKTPLAGLRTQAGAARRQSRGNAIQPAPVGHRIGARHPPGEPAAAAARAENPAAIGLARTDLNAIAYEQAMHWVPHALSLSTDLGFEGAETPVEINGNPLLLAELLNNLVDNALRGGHITVRVQSLGEQGVLEVEDSGPGIAPEERERVFDRFTACWARCPTAGWAWRSCARSRRPPGHGRHQRPSKPLFRSAGHPHPRRLPLYAERTVRRRLARRCADMPAHASLPMARRLAESPKQRDAHAFGSCVIPSLPMRQFLLLQI